MHWRGRLSLLLSSLLTTEELASGRHTKQVSESRCASYCKAGVQTTVTFWHTNVIIVPLCLMTIWNNVHAVQRLLTHRMIFNLT